MPLKSIRGKFAILFLSFFLLVVISTGVIYWALNTQKADAVILNLAGRQRMLTQQMTWLALNAPANEDLGHAIRQFEFTLQALREGGIVLDSASQAVPLPPAPDAELAEQLSEVMETWTSFREKLTFLRSSPVDDITWIETANQLQTESPLILAQLDAIVMEFEQRAEAKVARLLWLEFGFTSLAFMLLVGGYQLTRRRVLAPLAELEISTKRIGQGDFSQPIQLAHEDEFGQLAEIFENMRGELSAARELLEDRVVRRTRELSIAFEFSQEIVAQLDLAHLLQSVTERTQTLMHADAVALCLLNADQAVLELAANRGVRNNILQIRQPIGEGLAERVFETGLTLADENTCSGCRFLTAQGHGHCLAAPLKVGDQYLGALCISRQGEQTFDEDEKRALTLLVNAAAIAIVNANLAASERREAQQVAALAERERLAAELHDHLAQTLSFMRIKTGRVREAITEDQSTKANDELTRLQSALDMAYTQVREALAGLRQPVPVGDDLAQKLIACKVEFENHAELPLILNIEHPEAMELPSNVQVQIIHIIRGALSNIHRHAHASLVQVHVKRQTNQAIFIVEDDGHGFDPQVALDDHHLGLHIMRTRAERSGGKLTVESTPGHGTRVSCCFPLQK